jgi:uncharacterized protein (DUF1697 family)
MPQYIAFLRAINVGGHTVKMDHLRRLFEELDFAQVTTFIASGNVIFQADDPPGEERALEARIGQHLHRALGYEVATFLRTPDQLAAVAQYQPFAATAPGDGGAHMLYVSFLPEPPTQEAHARLVALRNEIDDFQVYGREAYWLRRAGGQSKFTGAALEKALRMPATMRNMTTVRKLTALYPPTESTP